MAVWARELCECELCECQPQSGLALAETKLDCAKGDTKSLGDKLEVSVALVKVPLEVFVGDTT
jgi:hypothetical protein